jgi:hypothetical protein
MWKEFWYTHFADLLMGVADMFEDLRQQPCRDSQWAPRSTGSRGWRRRVYRRTPSACELKMPTKWLVHFLTHRRFQAVCDSRRCITWRSTKCCGSTHDSTTLNYSVLGDILCQTRVIRAGQQG